MFSYHKKDYQKLMDPAARARSPAGQILPNFCQNFSKKLGQDPTGLNAG